MSLEISESNKVLTPTLTWYQVNDAIILSFELYNSIKKNISITNNNILLNVMSNNNEYKMEFELSNEINSDDSTYIIDDKSIKMILKKTNDDKWSSLTNDKNLYKNNIKINWNRWINDSDDEDEQQEQQNPFGGNQQFDFQQMMQNMGGMGDMESMMKSMGGMGDMESMMKSMGDMGAYEDDEDDEDGENGEDGEDGEDGSIPDLIDVPDLVDDSSNEE